MTTECKIKYIQYIQCRYSDLVSKVFSAYKLSRSCPELEMKMLIVKEYLDSIYCYNTEPEEGKTLDEINCLTEKEICSIVNHSIELTEPCNC
jgi:hypothetical protein